LLHYGLTCCDAFTSPTITRACAESCLGRRSNKIGRIRSLSTATKAVNDDEVEDLSSLTVVELKDRLRELNLTVGGRKNELIERLNEYFSSQPSLVSNYGEQDEDIGDESSGLVAMDDEPPEVQSNIDDLNKLTVPALKERLRQLGLPLGGRKAELIKRLEEAATSKDGGKDDLNIGGELFGDDMYYEDSMHNVVDSSSVNDDEDSMLSNILGEILDSTDEDGDSSNNLPPLEGDVTEDYPSSESASTRRARRKKYWKTQEVRDLISANDPQAPAKAEEMIATLEKMAEEESNGDYLPGPIQYTLLIDAYAKSGTDDAMQRAEAVIDRVLESDEQSDGTSISASAQMLNAVMGVYANTGTVEAAEKATTLLDRLEYLQEFGGSVKPTVHSYSIAISAWTKCESADAAIKAESILNRLFENYDEVLQSEDQSSYAEELKPNNIVMNSCMDAW
jgi:hypothetical protein